MELRSDYIWKIIITTSITIAMSSIISVDLLSYAVNPAYLSTLTTMSLSCAFVFELPMIVFFLAKAGLITPEIMRLYRKHAIVVILVVAAIITPPDVSSQLIVTIPILLLYEVSINIARVVGRNRLQKLNDDLVANNGQS